ncbi:toxic anion resistance protein [Paenibacillus tarimensis]|uniref:toxic anion resistance protein n=1 Tax=Paenibacillus tarimensis TaxID=416012 RepID=UPI001F33C692|nr:toxic anion resistance protein [Paenibacillus tarimensis]MCF2943507.1 toxic anion resistance protein [Paenibacillus tarimensis]
MQQTQTWMEDTTALQQAWLPDTVKAGDNQEARRLAAALATDDPSSVSRFGSDIQEEIAEFTSTVLDHVRARDAGDIGELMTDLISKIQQIPTSGTERERQRRLLVSIPAVSRLINRVKRSALKANTLEAQVEAVRAKLELAHDTLEEDIAMLEQVLMKNVSYYKKLELHIAAIQLRLQEITQEELPDLKVKADKAEDPWAVQQLNDTANFAKRLETRLDDFRRTRYLSLAQAPKIRLLQHSAQMMIDKIQAVLHQLIPVWKMDLITGVAEERASRALALHGRIKDAIESSLKESAERARLLNAEVAAAGDKGLIGIETLRSVHDQLIGALEDTMRIYQEGSQHREEAAAELAAMEQELKSRLAEVASCAGA